MALYPANAQGETKSISYDLFALLRNLFRLCTSCTRPKAELDETLVSVSKKGSLKVLVSSQFSGYFALFSRLFSSSISPNNEKNSRRTRKLLRILTFFMGFHVLYWTAFMFPQWKKVQTFLLSLLFFIWIWESTRAFYHCSLDIQNLENSSQWTKRIDSEET